MDQRRRIPSGTRSEMLLGESPAPRQEVTSRALRRKSGALNTSLQKSIQLLDEAVGTPPPTQRLRRTPGQLRHTSYTPKQIPSTSRFDVSGALGSTPGASFSQMSRFAGLDNTSYAALPTATPMRAASAMDTINTSGLMEDMTTTNVGLLLEEDPGLAASTALFAEFQQSLRDHPSETGIFELVKEFEDGVGEHVKILKKLMRRTTPGQNKFDRIITSLTLLEQETSTWRLIRSLYTDRLETERQSIEEDMLLDQMDKRQSEKEVMQCLFERDSSVRQAQLVVDWLEETAKDVVENYYDKVEFFADKGASWENTLHALQQQASCVPSSLDRPLVKELDPDAPFRLQQPLADLDQEDEDRILKYLFVLIRAGQLAEAQSLCSRCGQMWRAATLEGWRLHNDPNYSRLGAGGQMEPIEGNPYRDVWKNVCWHLSKEMHHFEKAMYAAMSGNLKQLLPVCESWEDYLWAYLKISVDVRVEQEIRMNVLYDRPQEELPSEYWDGLMSLEQIFREVQASPNDRVRVEAKHQFPIIQKFLILNEPEGLIEEMYSWVKFEENPPAPHLIRFMAHLVLFLRAIGRAAKEELCVAVLETYVKHLIETNQTDLVATYVSKLPGDLQVEWYAKFLEGIQEKGERQRCLELAEDVGLEVPLITKLVVENIRQQDSHEFSIDGETTLEAATSKEDRLKIEAIDWLVFDPSQRAEALRQGNAVMRKFLAFKKHSAAREVFAKIPAGSIDVIYRNCMQMTNATDLPAEDDNAIREYLCIQAYLDAHDSFNDWFEHFHHAKPTKPTLPGGSNFQERVAYEHREKQYHCDLERWQHSLSLQTKATVERMFNVLLFVDGGWMVDQKEESEIDESRQQQMSLLRQLCIPNMCYLLHSVLHTTEQYQQGVELADVIASEQHQLYKVFRKDELQKLLRLLRDSSIALLDNNKGPLGYDLR